MKSRNFLLRPICIAVAFVVLMSGFASFIAFLAKVQAHPPATAPVAAPGAPPSAIGQGHGIEAVIAFYAALLQDEPPTADQERGIFTPASGLRTRLVHGDRKAADDEPMTRTPERRRERELEMQKTEAAGPVVLNYLRAHREWFLPTNGIESRRDIVVSSFVQFVRSLEAPKPLSMGGWIIVIFPEMRGAKPARLRTVVFGIAANGTINPDDIRLDGFGGEAVIEKALAGEAKDVQGN